MHDDFKKDVGARGKFSKRTSKKYRNPILKNGLKFFTPKSYQFENDTFSKGLFL